MRNEPLHLQIAALLEREIAAGFRPGERLPGERALARRFGVSQLTLSKALAVLAEKGRVDRRHGSGTYVREPGPRWLGVMLESNIGCEASSYFHRFVAQRSRELLEARGYLTRLYAGFGTPGTRTEAPTCRDFRHDLEAGALAGIIALSGTANSGAQALARRRGVPVAGMAEGADARVSVDYRPAIGAFVDHALARGRRRLALLDWAEEGGPERESALRRSFREALAGHGLEPAPEWLRGDLHPGLPGAGWEQLREIWTATPERPEAVIIGDEHLIADVGAALPTLGITPGEVLFYGLGTRGQLRHGIPSFPLELAELDAEAVAVALAESLCALLREPRGPVSPVVIPYRWEAACSFNHV